MKQHTLIYTDYCDHVYMVTIGTDIGEFTGAAFCKEEDRHYESEYVGYELAELKAEIYYSKAKKKEYEAQLKALTRFWREMSNTRTYDIDAYWVKKMRQRVDEIENQKCYWANRVAYLKEAYHEKILAIDAFNRKRSERQ